MEKYFIFSDEAGSWGNENNYFYVRSWVKTKEEDFYRLNGLWTTKKLPYPTKKSLLKNDQDISGVLKNGHFIFFFTFTKLNEFYLRKFNIKDKIMEQLMLVMAQLEYKLKTYMKDQIPAKVKSAINYVLFLNMYEAYHLENAWRNLFSANQKLTFIIDKPQFSENDYLKVFKDKINSNESELIFSHKEKEEKYSLGIYIADSFASLCWDLLLSCLDSPSSNQIKIINYFKEYILSKSVAGNIGLNGINKVFYPVNRGYGNEILFSEEEKLIKNLLNKLS